MSGDPNEYVWKEFYAALLTVHPAAEARRCADAALAEYVERWPRGREVITVEEHKRMVSDFTDRALHYFAEAFTWTLNDAQVTLHHADRYDAAACVHALVPTLRAAVAKTLVTGDAPRLPCDLPARAGDEAALRELRRLLGLTEYAKLDSMASWVEQRLVEAEERGVRKGRALEAASREVPT